MCDSLNDSEIIKEYFNNSYLNKLIEQHINGSHNHSHRLWALMNLEWWYERFFIES